MARGPVAGGTGRARPLARLVLLAAALAACAQPPGPARTLVLPEAANTAPSAVVVVSVAGLTPETYRGVPPETPTLAALAEAGASADAVRSVAPASSYPAHATLGSGRRPAGHGVVADRQLGEHGVGTARYSEASALRAPTLWEKAAAAGLRVATLDWPSTLGAEVASNLPDVEPQRGESWLDALRRHAQPPLLALAEAEGAGAPDAAAPGPARDAVLVGVACRLFAAAPPPQLLFLHLSETAAPLRLHGAAAPQTRAAFAALDQQIARLLACMQDRGRLAATALVVVGDHGVMPVHTVVAPNVALAASGLLTPGRAGQGLVGWSALARSNGGSAFVYARSKEDALLARRALEEQAAASGAFRVVSAREMLDVGADPDAWFGLEAEPGFVFSDAARGPLLDAAVTRGGGGYLPTHPEMDAGFVAWGAGIARGVRIPEMRQTDVAPTLAPLLGVELEGAEGRVLIGVLRLPTVSAVPKP
jgi:predicted AlkP superfamily pyrophosphatase or phosphodiesterase